MVERNLNKLPRIIIPNLTNINELESLTYDDFRLENYVSIKLDMSIHFVNG
jgi:thymidylate synthase